MCSSRMLHQCILTYSVNTYIRITSFDALLPFSLAALYKRRWIMYYYLGWLLRGIPNMRGFGICLVVVSRSQIQKAAEREGIFMEMQENQFIGKHWQKLLWFYPIMSTHKNKYIYVGGKWPFYAKWLSKKPSQESSIWIS